MHQNLLGSWRKKKCDCIDPTTMAEIPGPQVIPEHTMVSEGLTCPVFLFYRRGNWHPEVIAQGHQFNLYWLYTRQEKKCIHFGKYPGIIFFLFYGRKEWKCANKWGKKITTYVFVSIVIFSYKILWYTKRHIFYFLFLPTVFKSFIFMSYFYQNLHGIRHSKLNFTTTLI